MNPKVDAYLKKAKKWREEIEALRAILLDTSLTEELKWGKPCYTLQGSNVVIILPLKEYCVLLFCKGALLKDSKGLLFRPSENTQAARQLRLSNLKEIVKLTPTLKAYVREAMEVEEAGLEVPYKKITEHKVPEELQKKLNGNAALKKAFTALTPGRQRGYFLYISGAKQSATREARVEKCTPRILKGKGLNDE